MYKMSKIYTSIILQKMNKYWYKHFYNIYSELLKDEYLIDSKGFLKDELKELKELFKNGSIYRYGVLVFYNPDNKAMLEGKANAINTLLGHNNYIYAP